MHKLHSFGFSFGFIVWCPMKCPPFKQFGFVLQQRQQFETYINATCLIRVGLILFNWHYCSHFYKDSHEISTMWMYGTFLFKFSQWNRLLWHCQQQVMLFCMWKIVIIVTGENYLGYAKFLNKVILGTRVHHLQFWFTTFELKKTIFTGYYSLS